MVLGAAVEHVISYHLRNWVTTPASKNGSSASLIQSFQVHKFSGGRIYLSSQFQVIVPSLENKDRNSVSLVTSHPQSKAERNA